MLSQEAPRVCWNWLHNEVRIDRRLQGLLELEHDTAKDADDDDD